MTEPLGKLERELLAMRPKAPGDETIDSLVRSTSQASRRGGDWFLIGAMGSGLAAAVVIVAMVSIGVTDEASGNRTTTSAPLAQTVPQRAGDSLTTFARADGDWAGVLK